MSAFIVGKAHIDALVQAGLLAGRGGALRWYLPESGTQHRFHQLDHTSTDQVGAMLWKENVRSIRYRYPDVGADLTDAPGPIGLTAFEVKGYTFPIMSARRLSPVEALKALSCYEYQSCEHPEWATSEAKAFCDALRHAMIYALPGYEDAEWEITHPAPKARQRKEA